MLFVISYVYKYVCGWDVTTNCQKSCPGCNILVGDFETLHYKTTQCKHLDVLHDKSYDWIWH